MTHHKNRSAVPGPRRLQRRAETGRRMDAIRRAADKDIVTVPAIIVQVRAQTELDARDKAERMRGGPGDRAPFTTAERLERYGRTHPRGLTTAQARQVRRKSRPTHGDAYSQVYADYGWTLPKGHATPQRQRPAKDVEVGGRKFAAFLGRFWAGVRAS